MGANNPATFQLASEHRKERHHEGTVALHSKNTHPGSRAAEKATSRQDLRGPPGAQGRALAWCGVTFSGGIDSRPIRAVRATSLTRTWLEPAARAGGALTARPRPRLAADRRHRAHRVAPSSLARGPGLSCAPQEREPAQFCEPRSNRLPRRLAASRSELGLPSAPGMALLAGKGALASSRGVSVRLSQDLGLRATTSMPLGRPRRTVHLTVRARARRCDAPAARQRARSHYRTRSVVTDLAPDSPGPRHD